MAPLVLTYDDTCRAISIAEAIDAIEAAYREEAAGKALASERVTLWLPNGWLRLMAAGLLDSGVIGYKAFHRTEFADSARRPEVRYAFHLFDYTSGQLLALMDANYLTAIRTAATAGVAAKYLARTDATRLGVLGSGSEARAQLEAMAVVRPISQVKVYSRSATRREMFAQRMSERLGINVQAVERPEHAIDGVDILVVATNTGTEGPALLGKWLYPGLHVSSIGSTLPTQREIDAQVWVWADKIVLDTRRVLQESGDALAAIAEGVIDDRKLFELSAIVAGHVAGRMRSEETTLYKSIGTSVQDVAVAFRIYKRARDCGLGQQYMDYQSPKQAS
ncbi:MAG TPA: ornithine cyclodeaminase family protein [Chloroflexota bacterium]|nr:ornithine cyclodeaminase family protein [Chloroflexota bacterium]